MEKKIIVPVDFSEVSYNAYLYARGIARDLNCSLEVIHTYKISYSRSNFASFMAELGTYSSISKALENFVNTYPDEQGNVLTKLNVETKVIEDNAISYIIERSRAEDVLMILMGYRWRARQGRIFYGIYLFQSGATSYLPCITCA